MKSVMAGLVAVSSATTSTFPVKNRGAFLLFEGIDRCGKSTQADKLSQYIASYTSSEFIRFPDRTSLIGQLINSYLTSASNMSDQTVHLLFSANRWEASAGIEEKLSSGTTLICDRYAYSGVAYSSAKGLDLEWCKAPDRGLPAPDAIIYLDLTVEEAAQRGSYGAERYEKIEFQSKIREKFLSLQSDDIIPWHTLDARKSMEELEAEIKIIADQTIADVKQKPISRLWL